jgi:ribosome maturation factor RimP
MIDLRANKEIEDIIKKEGHNLYSISYHFEDGDQIMQINIINKENPLNLDECVRMTKIINPILDNYGINEGYRVEVGSAGIERSIKDKKQWEFNIGDDVKIKLDKKGIKGKLLEVKDNYVLINHNGKEEKVQFVDILKAKTYFV